MEKPRKNKANILAKNNIFNALLSLIEEKNLSSINIAELTEKAGVSRMTFYRNYDSIEHVLTEHLADVAEEYKKADPETLSAEPVWGPENVIRVLNFLKQKQVFFRSLFKCGMGNLFLQKIIDYEMEKWQITNDDINALYSVQIFSGGLYNLYIAWEKNDFRESPEELVEIVNGLFKDTMFM